jgi:hypothetical protein
MPLKSTFDDGLKILTNHQNLIRNKKITVDHYLRKQLNFADDFGMFCEKNLVEVLRFFLILVIKVLFS